MEAVAPNSILTFWLLYEPFIRTACGFVRYQCQFASIIMLLAAVKDIRGEVNEKIICTNGPHRRFCNALRHASSCRWWRWPLGLSCSGNCMAIECIGRSIGYSFHL
jgi:hypothetical protein